MGPASGRCGFDLAVVGAGICGLAHALAAARRGKRVIVIDRDAQANGASIRNFGFITVTGQEEGVCWTRAMRSRDRWAELAAAAGIEILHRGLVVAARRPEAMLVLEEFQATSTGAACRLFGAAAAAERFPALRRDGIVGCLWSPHEIRVESKLAIPRIAQWLEAVHGVVFWRETLVQAVEPPRLVTTRGPVQAEACIVCPGEDALTLFADRLAAYGLRKCRLQMLRLAAPAADWRLGHAVMSDLGLVRYRGYARLPASAALRRRLEAEQPAHLSHGIHLIAVQSGDGSLIVGDSHCEAATPDPFASSLVDELVLDEYRAVLAVPKPVVTERWTGLYATAADGRLMLIDRPEDAVRIVIITSGTGASTAFAIGEEVVGELFDDA